MRSDTRRRGGRLALTVLSVVIGLPGLAEAQQTGLFPNAPIRRQRPAPDQEDPVYEIYKQQYFGYHPTCWRRFPGGWGCPSPEAPDLARSLKEHAFGTQPDQAEDANPLRDDGREQPGGAVAPKPGVPDRDPFDMDDEAAPRGGNTAPPRVRQPQPQPAPPTLNDSPFNDVPGGGDPAAPAPTNPRGGAANAGAMNRGISYRSQGSQPNTDPGLQPVADEPPLLAMPNLSVNPPADGTMTLDPVDASTPVGASANSASASTPTGNPPRRSLIGSFFSNLGMNWTRR